MSDRSVLIIGAGAAGLAAAVDLSRAGRRVIVVEARDRIGGRVLTLNDPSFPVPIELGAEFIHGKPPELCHLAKAVNRELYETSGRHWFFQAGEVTKSHEFWQQIEALMAGMESAERDQSLREFLEQLPDDEKTVHGKAMLVRYVEGFHAANIDRIGIQGLIKANEAADDVEGDRAFRPVEGYQPLMAALRAEAETAGAVFHFSTTVREIDWSGDEVRIACESAGGAETLNAGAGVITMPLGVLQQGAVRFVPPLPEPKQKAVAALIMGNVLKLNLRFRDRFWERVKRWDEDGNVVSFADAGFFHAPDAAIPTWWTQLPMRAPLLVGWAGGPRADDLTARGEKEIIELAADSLGRILKLPSRAIVEQLEGFAIHNWRDDPFSLGAYAYLPVAGLEAQRALAEPLSTRLFFAGEATSVGHIGTVHGAIQSGQRAAREVIELQDRRA